MQPESTFPYSPKKTIKIPIAFHTPSARKPRISIKNDTKNRQSTRKTINRNYANIQICQKAYKATTQAQINEQQQMIDQGLLRQIEQLTGLQKQKQAHIESVINERIIPIQSLLEKIKENKQKLNRKCIENKQLERNYQLLVDKMNINYISLKKSKDQNHLQTKKRIYEYVDEQDRICDFLEGADKKIVQKKQQLEERMNCVVELSQKLIVSQNQHQKLIQREAECANEMKQLRKRKRTEEIQLSTIKIQMSPNLWIGLNILKTGIDQNMALSKEISLWDKNKQRKVEYEDLKRFVIIQLYRGWKGILRKISYQSSQYEVLFGDILNPEVVDNIRDNIIAQPPRVSQKKQSKAILFFSENGNQNRKQQLRKLFQNFNNGLIHITQVDFTQEEGGCFMNLQYYLNGQEKAVQSYLVEQSKNVNKEEIGKWLKMTDKRIFCWIDIPVVINRQQQNRYDEVYELVRKKCAWK